MKRKGFTLIELLAVIIILAVIALIATPVVLNVIENSRKQANRDSVYGILDSAKLYYADSLLVDSNNSNLNGTTNLIDKISISGDKPDSGVVYINDKGETAIAVVYDKICYIKNFNENDIKESNDVENCNLGVEETEPIEDLTAPEVSISSISTRTDAATVVAICSDTESGIKKYEFSKDNGATYVSAGTTATYTFTGLTQDTEYTFTVRCTNGVDLTETNTLAATTSLVNAPTVTQTNQTPSDTEYAQQRVIRITYSNENLEGAKHYYSLDGTTWTEVSTITHDLTFTSNGEVYAKTVDAAGNVAIASTYTVTNMDTTKPNSSITIGKVTTSNIVVNAICSDTESGITKYEFSNDGATWINNGTSGDYTFTGLTKGTEYEISARCTNGSGLTEVAFENVTTASVDYKCVRATETTYGSLGTAGVLASGDAFDCDVNGDGSYDSTTERFYYVSDLYDGATNSFNSEYAVLIYNNNTKDGVINNASGAASKYSNTTINNNGPTIAMTNLPTTTQWSNVSLSNSNRRITNELGTYTTYNGQQTIVSSYSYEGYAARLLTYQELVVACGDTDPTATNYLLNCNYLLENTRYTTGVGPYGYWLETPPSTSKTHAYFIYTANKNVDSNLNYNTEGNRPVIEVLKTEIQYK